MKRALMLVIIFFLALPQPVSAEYMLPYPSFMPGNRIYIITRLVDAAREHWSWGNIARTKYHLGLSDKYLVESKTLSEYKQYLLMKDALTRSDFQATKILTYVNNAEGEGKDVAGLREIVADAMAVHWHVLERMQNDLPHEFLWQPENEKATDVQIADLLEASQAIRKEIRDAVLPAGVPGVR
jgi:hypothetical protein